MHRKLWPDLTHEERVRLPGRWANDARGEQLPPPGDWRLWLILAGRGFGKTRAGAEWVLEVARTCPTARIALVAASLAEARAVMVEGESGVLSCAPSRRRPIFEPSLRRLTWRNGATATLYSAAEPESLRGPQHSHAWCDEIARWDLASPAEGECWLAGTTPTGDWSGHAGEFACFEAGSWIFLAPRDGLRLLDRSTGQVKLYRGGWSVPTTPAAPSGGTTIDAEARTAIADLIAVLDEAGILPA